MSLTKKRYTYNEISEQLNLPVRTIRYWVTEGLIEKPEVIEKKNRFFNYFQLKEIESLKILRKEAGLPIEKVHRLKKIIAQALERGGCAPVYPLATLEDNFHPIAHEHLLEIGNFLIEGTFTLVFDKGRFCHLESIEKVERPRPKLRYERLGAMLAPQLERLSPDEILGSVYSESFSKEERIAEIERRIERYKDEIRYLRYKIIRKLKRRKK